MEIFPSSDLLKSSFLKRFKEEIWFFSEKKKIGFADIGGLYQKVLYRITILRDILKDFQTKKSLWKRVRN